MLNKKIKKTTTKTKYENYLSIKINIDFYKISYENLEKQ